jgi:uracil-DNA glycosylase
VNTEKLDRIRYEIANHPSNAWAKALGYDPLYTASPNAKIVIIGQAPGRKAQESGIPWHDASGDTLRKWLGVGSETFYNSDMVALIPMDFYYPGKASSGDLPPRKEFASLWHSSILTCMPNVEITVLIGSYAQAYYLGDSKKPTLSETVRAYAEYLPTYFPIAHPSPLTFRWRAQNPWFVNEVVPVLQERISKTLLGN